MRIKFCKEKYPLLYDECIRLTREHNPSWDIPFIESKRIGEAFLWDRTPQGFRFWSYINIGNWEKAEKLHPELFKGKELMNVNVYNNWLCS